MDENMVVQNFCFKMDAFKVGNLTTLKNIGANKTKVLMANVDNQLIVVVPGSDSYPIRIFALMGNWMNDSVYRFYLHFFAIIIFERF
jgi:hypothetical protein